jgi:RHS repeat-associated protein
VVASSGLISAEYAWLNGEPLAHFRNGSTYFVHNDHLATPQRLTDSTGAVAWSADYEPFGKAQTTGIEFNLRFPGQYFDAETGLHYNWHRYYDPETGRYITSDPIGLRAGLNTYRYASQNPLTGYDIYGLWTITVDAYRFVGAGVTISYSHGKLEVIGRAGVGMGGGFSWNPEGVISEHSHKCKRGYILRTTATAFAELHGGPVGTGIGLSASSGNGLVDKSGGGYSDKWGYASY